MGINMVERRTRGKPSSPRRCSPKPSTPTPSTQRPSVPRHQGLGIAVEKWIVDNVQLDPCWNLLVFDLLFVAFYRVIGGTLDIESQNHLHHTCVSGACIPRRSIVRGGGFLLFTDFSLGYFVSDICCCCLHIPSG
jgi:hypothetical protein